MTVLAHLTSLDLPTLATAFVAGVALGAGLVWKLAARRGR
ncbi:hypothetical protein MalM25_32620 [Planctomycetes bacterium MalM25]|nr:hypothetical protein MalM25_32620 [Planctomycetes bacterium MalM25]